mmetsp:Transcript_41717/g.135277  ORF Transcript_41717/g.135277 Transcript_41717/m.135277 type:complete len:106 (+) Transcript_41717:1135-1452(+)
MVDRLPGPHLGYFGTAVEAAVAYARHCAELEASSGRGDVQREWQGRLLHLSRRSSTGYLGVYRPEGQQGRPFMAFSPRQRDGRKICLGSFGSRKERRERAALRSG